LGNRPYNPYNDDNHLSDREQEMMRISNQAAEDIVRGLSEANGKGDKFLGFIPPEVSMIARALWAGTFPLVSDHLRNKFYSTSIWLGGKAGVSGNKLIFGSAVAATVLTASAAVAPYIEPFFSTRKNHRENLRDAAKRIAPILDEMKGKHSIGAFAGIKPQDNEMIYVQRRRINDLYSLKYSGDFLRLLTSAPELLKISVGWKKYIGGKLGTVVQPFESGSTDISAKGITAAISGPLAMVLDKIVASKSREHRDNTPPYSALDMILTLEGQLGDDSRNSSFALPSGGGGQYKRDLPLKEYVAEIIRHHQQDMNKLDVEYVPIRNALNPRLDEISGIIADALKSGDLSALALVRLVGEGHIIKNKGRSLAKPADVKALVTKMSAAGATYSQLDPKEYFAEAAFNAKELKEALHTLEGEERLTFAAMVPDTVLKEVGLSDKEVKEIRTATLKSYEDMLGKAVLGMAKEEDATLQDFGLAKEEITLLREAAERIAAEGKDAVHELRAKPGNPKGAGMERILVQSAINRIHAKDTHYLGKLLEKGAEAAKNLPDEEEAADHETKRGSGKSHARHEYSRREAQMHEEQELGA
jgi:hypothetical protein